MTKRRRSSANRLLLQLSKLSLAAPQVVAHRVGRMATAGTVLSDSDREEFTGMVVEKQVALAASVQNMWLAGAKANHELLVTLTGAMTQPGGLATGARLVDHVNQAAMSVLSEGLAPIERKASANARRLARIKGK
ncbi:MAG: hypothetical protein HYZ20_11730 [Burkholderiales bacterium]|nr:hypothetical protein [Burkholderiales bacterium]